MDGFEENAMIGDQKSAVDHASHQIPMDFKTTLNSSDMDLSGEERVLKVRKPYTITKQREKWTVDEHKKFLEALQLHGRAWRRIQEHIGTKTAVQIRSHAQKFFSKVVRESSGNSSSGTAAAIQIPPPRPKRKPAHPYPRKLGSASRKPIPVLKQLEKPPLQMQSLCEQENGSPTSVLTAAQIGTETLGLGFSNNSSSSRSLVSSATGSNEQGNEGGSLASVDREDRCPSPSIATAELTKEVLPAKESEMNAKCNDTLKEVSYVELEAPVLKLFGKRVVVTDKHPDTNTENLKNGRDMELDAPAESPTWGTGKVASLGTADGSTSSPWLSGMQQFLYYLPQGSGLTMRSSLPWFSYNGSMPCPVLYPQAATSNQQHQPSELVDYKVLQREGSWTGSNTASSSVPGTAAQNSDVVESQGQGNSSENEAVPVPSLRKSVSSASISQRGFMPYKRCAAESEVLSSQAPREEADGELTRLCL